MASDAQRLARLEAMVRQLQGALDGLRVVRGVVQVSGGTPSILEGTGFSITDNGPGDYTVTLDAPFSDRPAVTLAASDWAAVVPIGNLAAGSFRVVVFNTTTGGVVDNVGFSFIAAGPG